MIVLRKSKQSPVQRRPDGTWGIISPKTGRWWKRTFPTKAEAIGALREALMEKEEELVLNVPNSNNVVEGSGKSEQQIDMKERKPDNQIDLIVPKNKTFSERLEVSQDDLQKAKTYGVIQRRPDNGKWGIIAIRRKLWWNASYDSRKNAEDALKAYQANKH